jgi:CheY-like chemotaxis protein
VLHETGLIGSLNWLVSRMEQQHQFTFRLRADSKAEPPSEETRFLLFECVRELLLNVVKHAGVGEAEVTLIRADESEIAVIVKDKGRGFDPDLLKNRRPDETSFGLFSIQERLAYLGGRMEIESAPGRGTYIKLALPLALRKQVPDETFESASVRDHEKTVIMRRKPEICRVLIVDDHKIMREGLAGLLRFQSNIEVVGEAADGQQAMELAEKLGPDVIIMDVNLGTGMDGIEATRRILAEDPGIKVIGLSMHEDKNMANAMRDAGAVAYLTKGGPSKKLVEAIRACAPKISTRAQ